MHQRVIGAMCTAMGLALILSGSPGKADAQQLEKVPKPAPLAGTEWVMIESDGQRVPQNGWQPHFELKELERNQDGSAGQVEGIADSCSNRLTGTYQVTANRLRFEIDNVAASLRTCIISKDMPLERIDLNGSPQFQIHGSELDLFESTGVVRARFIAAGRE
jgi:heat shock protein HslJ